MAPSTIVVCYNMLENRYFRVNAVHDVNDPYRKNYYKLQLRLIFMSSDVEMLSDVEMNRLCYKKIMNLMTNQNIWQNNHGFYVVEYEIRTLPGNDLNQQNGNYVEQNQSAESVSTDSSFNDENDDDDDPSHNENNDSAYESPNYSSSSGSVNYWTDDESFLASFSMNEHETSSAYESETNQDE
jgi:hypothetical protein